MASRFGRVTANNPIKKLPALNLLPRSRGMCFFLATVDLSLSDLNALAGTSLTAKQAEETAAMLGMPLEKSEGDRLVFEISPNRPDWLSVEGIARSFASYLSVKIGLRPYSVAAPTTECQVDESFIPARPHVSACIARGMSLSEETIKQVMQLEEKISDTLGRRRKKISIGAYDLSKVNPPFHYIGAEPSAVRFVPLGMTAEMTLAEAVKAHPKGVQFGAILGPMPKWPIITDSKGQMLCLIPITNADSNKVTTATHDLFVEVNGTSRQAVDESMAFIVAQLLDRGAKVDQVKFTGAVSFTTPQMPKREMKTSVQAVSKLVGITVTSAQIASCLERMGYAARVYGNEVSAEIPFYRNDIMHENDLIEDVAIAYGYNNIKGRQPPFVTTGAKHPDEAFADRLRQTMIGLGFQDCLTFTLTNEKTHYERMLITPSERVRIANPLTGETTMVRTSLLPSLLSVLEANTREKYPQLLSEIGDTVLIDKTNPNGSRTQKKLCAVIASKDANLSAAKSALDALLLEFGIECKFAKSSEPFFIPSRSASFTGGNAHGYYGEINPQVLENFGIEMPVSAFEIWFD